MSRHAIKLTFEHVAKTDGESHGVVWKARTDTGELVILITPPSMTLDTDSLAVAIKPTKGSRSA